MTIKTKGDILMLVEDVKQGNDEAFRELEAVAKPLLVSLSNKFSQYHPRFEFADFYSISLEALYRACMSFKEGNPSFLNYAKVFIVRALWREIEHWNQDKRNIFKIREVELKDLDRFYSDGDMSDIAFVGDFRIKLNLIIDECFDEVKSRILKMHYLGNRRVCDIANETNMNYKYVHKIIERGTKKIKKEYETRYLTKGE